MVGGPIALTVVKQLKRPGSLLVTLDSGGRSAAAAAMRIGSPHRQSRVVLDNWRGRPDVILLLPPFILKAVASSLWPAALWSQVADVCFQ